MCANLIVFFEREKREVWNWEIAEWWSRSWEPKWICHREVNLLSVFFWDRRISTGARTRKKWEREGFCKQALQNEGKDVGNETLCHEGMRGKAITVRPLVLPIRAVDASFFGLCGRWPGDPYFRVSEAFGRDTIPSFRSRIPFAGPRLWSGWEEGKYIDRYARIIIVSSSVTCYSCTLTLETKVSEISLEFFFFLRIEGFLRNFFDWFGLLRLSCMHHRRRGRRTLSWGCMYIPRRDQDASGGEPVGVKAVISSWGCAASHSSRSSGRDCLSDASFTSIELTFRGTCRISWPISS